MTWTDLFYLGSIFLVCCLSVFLAVYAWRRRQSPGAQAYAGLAASQCFLALVEIFSTLSPSAELALFWFRVRYTSVSLVGVFWLLFALDYSGRKQRLTRTNLLGLLVIPIITQILLWTNPLHNLWAVRDAVFTRSGMLWLADISGRIPGLGFLTHSFYNLTLLLVGIVLLLLAAWEKRHEFGGQAFLLVCAGLSAVFFTANALFHLLPRLPFNSFTPGIALSVFFIALAVFRFQFLTRGPSQAQWPRLAPLRASESRALSWIMGIILLLVSGIAAILYLSYINFERHYRDQINLQLTAIADLQVQEVVNWRNERLGDAELIKRSSAFSALVQTYLQDPAQPQAKAQIQTWLDGLHEIYQYQSLIFIDPQGHTRITSPDTQQIVETHLVEASQAALASGEITILDFHRDASHDTIYLTILTPIYAGEDLSRPLGVVELRIDPSSYIFPYLSRWPLPSQTAETLLVRREGSDVLYLSPTRFPKDSELNLRVPLSDTAKLAIKAVLGETGVVEGKDYRGESVIGYIRAVPDSPWFLITSINTAEVYAPLSQRLLYTILTFVALMFISSVGLVLYWRQQRLQYYKSQLQTLEKLRSSEEKFRLAFETSPDAMAIFRMKDGLLISINPGFEKNFGYSAGEVLGKTSIDLQLWADLRNRQETLDILGANGRSENIDVHLRTKTGELRHCLLSYSMIDLDGEAHVLAITRDITERVQAEEALHRRNQFLLALQQTTLELLSQLDLQTLLENIVQRAASLVNTSSGFLDLVDPDSELLRPHIGMGALSESLKHTMRPGQGVAGTVWQTGEPLAIDDYDHWPGRLERYSLGLISSIIGVPLISSGKTLGVLGLGYDAGSGRRFDAEAIEELSMFARLAALAIENARLFAERKQAEESLRTRENLLRNIFEVLPVGLWVVDKDGAATQSNPVGRQIWGIGSGQGVKSIRRLPTGEELTVEKLQQFYINQNWQPSSEEMLEIETTDGKRKTIMNYITPVINDDGQVDAAVIVNLDITEPRQAEALLQARLRLLEFAEQHTPEELLARMLDEICLLTGSPIAAYYAVENDEQTITMQSRSPNRPGDGQIEARAPRRLVSGMGSWEDCVHTRGPVIHNDCASLSYPLTLLDGANPIARELLLPILRQGKIVAILCAGNKAQNYDDRDIEIINYFADTVWEIVERKRAERAAAESMARETFLGELLSKATIAVGVGYPDGRLGMCNLAFLELTGYTEEDLRTINWNEDLTPREWAERERQALDKLSRIKKSVTYEKEYIHKSGRRVPVELVTHAVFDSQGQISHYYTFIRDITERKQIEAAKQEYNDRLEREVAQRTSELRSAQERLIRQERLAALGQIAGSIAHELRNPLGVISNAVYFLNLIKSETDPRVQEYLGIIESETRTAEKIVSDLLDRSRIKSPERQPCSAADLIQQVLKRYPLPPNVGLTLDLPENLPELYIDPGQIVQVIGNLLTNAYQAMPDGGRLNLSARQVNQNQVSISIADTGVGIPEENLSKLFEPLFTTKKRGVGLGLTLSKSLAEANDGKIEVQSTPGGGANFTIYLPSVQKGTEGSLPEDHNAVQ